MYELPTITGRDEDAVELGCFMQDHFWADLTDLHLVERGPCDALHALGTHDGRARGRRNPFQDCHSVLSVQLRQALSRDATLQVPSVLKGDQGPFQQA